MPSLSRTFAFLSVVLALEVGCGKKTSAPTTSPAVSASVSTSASSAPSASASAPASESASSAPTPSSSVAEGTMVTFAVPIRTKPGAVVKVAYKPASVVDGKVEIRGRVGQGVMVTARDAEGRLAVQKVMLEAEGPIPATIDLSK